MINQKSKICNSMDEINHTKSVLRARIIANLKEKPLDYFITAGLDICSHLSLWLKTFTMRPLKVALFENFSKEINTQTLAQLIKNLGMELYFIKDTPINLQNYELVFIPGVAFDKNGNRLGRGKGFFDKTLSLMDKNLARPVLVGLATDMQIIDKVPTQSHDYKMDFICSPKLGLISTKAELL
jgi:5-formyltetrahydrofolate cyclo-ligase